MGDPHNNALVGATGSLTPASSGAGATGSIIDKAALSMLRKHDFMRAFAELFLLIVGVLYATGFLTAFTFLQRFGVREAGTEFLKLKYIYVGILYFLFPATIMLPLGALWSLRRQSKRHTRDITSWKAGKKSGAPIGRGRSALAPVPVSFATVLLLLNMALVFYVLICFAPVTLINDRPWVVAAVSVPTIIGVLLFRFFEAKRLRWRLSRAGILRRPLRWILRISRQQRRRFRSRELTKKWRVVIWWRRIGGGRTVLFLAMLALVDYPAVRPIWGDLKLMFWGDSQTVLWTYDGFRVTPPIGGFNYYLFVFLYCLVGQRVRKRIRQYDGEDRARYLVAGGGIWVSLFIISVLVFALRVYPFIPALKGGGDYRKTAASLVLKQEAGVEFVPPQSVVIIEETDSSLFLAIPIEPPIKNTENTVAEGQWRVWKDLPTVIEIPREHIAFMHYWPPGKERATLRTK